MASEAVEVTVPTVTASIDVVEEPDPAEAIPKEDRESVPALGKWLERSDTTKRLGALAALGRLGARAKAARPTVEAALKDSHARVRIAAAESLWRITGDAHPSVAALVDVLRRGTPTAKIEAAFALGRIGPAAKGAVDALVEAVEGRGPSTNEGELRTDEDVIEDAYIDITPASAAADALGDIGPDAVSSLPALRKAAAAATDVHLRDAAKAAIEKVEARGR